MSETHFYKTYFNLIPHLASLPFPQAQKPRLIAALITVSHYIIYLVVLATRSLNKLHMRRPELADQQNGCCEGEWVYGSRAPQGAGSEQTGHSRTDSVYRRRRNVF